ncbi:metalloregulator ArsR/SmtB family transcription factor [Paenibacillus sp. Y412MC10]|uniref:ArsR/SmtB family transcription factor n=1 Tax=Geobacillus sp. (strain Y412MC10) TaxID=481743 RepID=UPI0011AB8CF0|nr:metalloregulator ArsR/SmtB family transcription factor [Paenibacillus sp. Y412MC10]
MEQIREMADKLKLLSDYTRLTMLSLLKDREFCVCELVEILEVSQPAVSQHLRKLKSQGVVKESKRGQWVYYSLNVADKPYIQAVLDLTPDSQTILSALNKQHLTSVCK